MKNGERIASQEETAMLLSNTTVSDEAKRQHLAEANEYVYDGTPTLIERSASPEGYYGGVEHNLKGRSANSATTR